MPSQGSKLRNWLVRFNLARPKDNDDEQNESDLRRIESTASQTSKRRWLYVNMKSSADSQDRIDEHSWVSNRVRTAKYTPLTFIPKNLFEQFRNVANLYFLFLVILQCIPLFGVTSPPLSAAPLIAILVITGIKDVFEDWKRNQSDRRVNTSITLTLSHWDNVNVPELTQGRWHRVKIVIGLFTMLAGIENEYTNAYIQARLKQQLGGSTNVPTCVKSQKEQDLEQLQTRETRNMPNINVHPPTEEVPRYEYDNGNNVAIDKPPQSNGTAANLTPQGKRLMSTMRTRSGSFRAELSNIFKPKPRMPYRPGMIPHSVLHRTTTQDTGATSNRHSMDMSSDCQSEQPAGHEPLNPDCRVKWKETMWQDIKAGDYVLMKNDEPVPADVIILSTSEPDGICYVETKNLDGETNLKMRRALQATGEIQSVHDCERASFYFESEPPHANLYQYNGVLRWQVSNNTDEDDSDDYASVSHQKTEAVTYSNILLRGCVLRNTKWVIGIVMFTGNETKIMLNTGKTPSKRSKMAKATNPHVVANFVLLGIMCIVSSIINSIEFRQSTSQQYFNFGTDGNTSAYSGFLTFWVTLILYQNIIPISLYISVEIVKTLAAYFIFADIDMYYEETDQPCIPKTWNISDDLGQIEYIFSDKTGTLTQNVMEFRRCTINGVAYGIGTTEAEEGAKKRENGEVDESPPVDDDKKMSDDEADDDDEETTDLETAAKLMYKKQADLFKNKYIGPNPTFVDPKLYDDLGANNQQSMSIVHFFSSLALCHTVIVERPDDDEEDCLEYKAQSPDEAALVATARDLGFAFVGREKDTMILDVMGERKQFELLNVLEFNSTRKRMSVIVRAHDSDRIILLCKGADSVVYERLETDFKDQPELEKSQNALKESTTRDLETFANQGLRTLCLAFRFISDEEYVEWKKQYEEAANSISNREDKLEEACEEIEHSLILLGGTAIEDRLQDGVPDTIAQLSQAGIKIWVLTGDKTETAINIGFACNLLANDMMLVVIKATTRDSTNEQLREAIDKIDANDNDAHGAQRRALVIDGATLKYALEPHSKALLLELGTRCASVVCCRVSPMQKAQVVTLVKKGLKVMTLAIGDGANDVSMIQAANVGIGISGVEGRQAVMASDYAIAQFRFLKKLLLVHGRWSYLRTAEMILTFFYKNIVWTFVLLWYQIFCQFSGTMMFDYSLVTLYNLVFTSLPCIFLGVWDQDLDADRSIKYPELYRMGLRNDIFKVWRFWLTVLDAIYQSTVCFFFPYMLFIHGPIHPDGLTMNGVYELGTIVAGIAVVVANLFVGITLRTWNWIQCFIISISTLCFFFWVAVYSQFNVFTFAGEVNLFGLGQFWLVLILTVVACFLPRIAAKYYLRQYHPYDNDIIREIELLPKRGKDRRISNASEDPNIIRTLNSHGESVSRLISRTTRRKSRTEYASDDTSSSDEDSPNIARQRRPSGRFPPSTPPRAMLNRHGRQPSFTSVRSDQILYLQSGKRTSFTGFAFSGEDSSPYDTVRQSFYRRKSESVSHPNLPAQDMEMQNVMSVPRERRDSQPDEDWITLNFAPLSRSESAPAPISDDHKMGAVGKSKMSNVVNSDQNEDKTKESIREFVTRRLSSPRAPPQFVGRSLNATNLSKDAGEHPTDNS